MSADSVMAFLSCPHCGERVSFTLLGDYKEKSGIYQSFWRCNNCDKSVVGEITRQPVYKGTAYELGDFLNIYPEPKPIEAPKGTPDDVADDYKEALRGLRVGNIKSSCIMAGSAVETACVHCGATDGGLKQKIAKLRAEGIVTKSLADWADEIRSIRIDAAHHADRGAQVTREDAEEAVAFAEMLFTYLYTLPGMIDARRNRRGVPS